MSKTCHNDFGIMINKDGKYLAFDRHDNIGKCFWVSPEDDNICFALKFDTGYEGFKNATDLVMEYGGEIQVVNMVMVVENKKGRTMMQGHGFDWVLQELKKDHKSRYQRRGWNGKDMYISKHLVGHDEMMSQSYIYMKTADGNTVPWVASQTDILAEDWIGITLVETI